MGYPQSSTSYWKPAKLPVLPGQWDGEDLRGCKPHREGHLAQQILGGRWAGVELLEMGWAPLEMVSYSSM